VIIVLNVYQIVGRSKSIDQLTLKDHKDPRKTLIYRMNTPSENGLAYFKHVRFFASLQDGYVPTASALGGYIPDDSAVQIPLYSDMKASILRWLSCGVSSFGEEERLAEEMRKEQERRRSSAAAGYKRTDLASSSNLMDQVYKEMIQNLEASFTGSAALRDGTPTHVEKYLVTFGSVIEGTGASSPGVDFMRRRAHIAMLEDSEFLDLLVLINKCHI
jgi:hypothetical protein